MPRLNCLAWASAGARCSSAYTMLARRSRAIWSMTARPEVAPHRVAAERQGQAGVLQPPGAEVGPEVEAGVGVGELALVDQQPDVDLAPVDRVLDLVERHHHRRRQSGWYSLSAR